MKQKKTQLKEYNIGTTNNAFHHVSFKEKVKLGIGMLFDI